MPFFNWKKDKNPTGNQKAVKKTSGDQLKTRCSVPEGLAVNKNAAIQRQLSDFLQQCGEGLQAPASAGVTTSSRLSKTLNELLHSQEAVQYLRKYLLTLGQQDFLDFWLDADRFQAAAVTRTRSCSQLSAGKRDPSLPSSGTKTENSQQSCSSTLRHNTPICNNESTPLSNSEGTRHSKSEGTHNGNSECTPTTNSGGTTSSQSADTPITNSSAHGCVSVATSVTPPRVSPCDAATSYHHLGTQKRASHNALESANPLGGRTVASRTDSHQNDGNFHQSEGNFHQNEGHFHKNEGHFHQNEGNSHQNEGNFHQKGGDLNRNSTSSQHDVKLEQSANSAECTGARIKTHCEENTAEASSVIESTIGDAATAAMCSIPGSKSDGCLVRTSGHKQSLQDKLLSNIASDAVRIFSRYIAQDASHPIGITAEMRQDAIRKICQEDGLVDPHSFEPCQQYVFQQLQQKYYAEFMASEYHCQHQIDLLTGSTVSLSDILYNDSALSYFTEYMEQENARPLLQCWLALDNFQQFLETGSPTTQGDNWQENQNDAMVLYERYFSLQATEPLGFDDRTRFEVESNICREGGPKPDCFSKPKAIVTALLNREYLPAYLRSEVYFKYLSDMINTVQASQCVPAVHTRKRKDSGSGGSEHSTQSESRKNTLLAGGRKVPHPSTPSSLPTPSPAARGSYLSGLTGGDMQMDGAMFNPDTLWQRPKSSLSVAKVDHLGRFVSDLEVQPDQEKGAFANFSLFKRGREKERAQEEMALQIAHMIIADVNATTQLATVPDGDVFKSEPLPD